MAQGPSGPAGLTRHAARVISRVDGLGDRIGGAIRALDRASRREMAILVVARTRFHLASSKASWRMTIPPGMSARLGSGRGSCGRGFLCSRRR